LPRYSPGFPLLLVPFIFVGGPDAAAWASFVATLVLAVAAALIAIRLAGLWALPLVELLVLAPLGTVVLNHAVLSDMPAAALLVVEVGLLMLGGPLLPVVVAGALGGCLVWVRPADAALLLAGLAGSAALAGRRLPRTLAYLSGTVPVLVVLGVWQAAVFGSPLATGYQAEMIQQGGSGNVRSLFQAHWILAPHSARRRRTRQHRGRDLYR
jgi:hypothetical protein